MKELDLFKLRYHNPHTGELLHEIVMDESETKLYRYSGYGAITDLAQDAIEMACLRKGMEYLNYTWDIITEEETV